MEGLQRLEGYVRKHIGKQVGRRGAAHLMLVDPPSPCFLALLPHKRCRCARAPLRCCAALPACSAACCL